MNSKKILLSLLILLAVQLVCSRYADADWIWRPDTGWMNAKEIIKATPEEQFEYAKRLEEQKEYKKAAKAFRLLIVYYPESSMAGTSALHAGKCLHNAGYNYSAFLALKRAARDYSDSINLLEVTAMYNIIGNSFLEGAKKEFLGLKIFSGESAAVEVFSELHNLDPWGDLGDDSLIGLGNSYMRVHDYNKAIDTFNTLIINYPTSPLLARARLQKAKCFDIKARDWSYDWLALSKAMEVLKEIDPSADIAKQADELREVIEERLAHKFFETGKFYLRRKRYTSAAIYFQKVLEEFATTLWAERAREEMLKIKDKIEDKLPKPEEEIKEEEK